MRALAPCAALVFAACAFDPAPPSGAVVRCSAERTECPAGFVCRASVGRCLPIGATDDEPPQLISATASRALAKRGDEVRFEVVSSQPLAAPPALVLEQGGREVPVALAAVDDTHFSGGHVVGADDVEGLTRSTITLVSVQGRENKGLAGPRFTVDFTPPAVANVAIVAPREAVAELVDVNIGEDVVLRVAFTEPVKSGVVVRAVAAAACGGATFTERNNRDGLADFRVAAPAGVDGCTYSLQLTGLEDLAGNALAQATLPLRYRVDGQAPTFTSLETLAPEVDGGWRPAQRFSEAARFGRVGLRFHVDDPGASLAVRFDEVPLGCGAAQCVASDAGRACFCEHPVARDAGEGAHTLAVVARDSTGNTAVRSAFVAYDFTAPSVLPASVTLTITGPAGAPEAVSQLGLGGSADLAFGLDEAPAQAPSVTATSAAVSCLAAAQTPTSFSTHCTGSAGGADGPVRFEVAASDDVDNARTQQLAPTLTVDTQAPAAPRTAEDGGLVFVRKPWGDLDAGPDFSLRVAPGAAEPGALLVVTTLSGSELGRGRLSVDGGLLPLAANDQPTVLVRAVDLAGNASPAVDVKDVVWVATLNGKVVGSLLENPHGADVRRRFTRALQQPSAVEVGAEPPRVVTGHQWRQPTAPPVTRNAAMAYDARRQVSVMFGGFDFPARRTLWEWDGRVWTERTPAAGGPSGRAYHAMTYDARRGRVILYGGRTTTGISDELWEWDGEVWTQPARSGPWPAPAMGHGLAYDSARRVVLLLGGTDGNFGSTNGKRLWAWDGARWTDLTPPGTSPLPDTGTTSLTYDAARDRLVAFFTIGGELFEWDGTAWARRTFTTGPAARQGPGFVYDSARQRVLCYGGLSNAQGSTAALWEWDGASWTQRTPAGAPGAIADMGAAYDEARARLVIFGGVLSSTSNTFEWNGATGTWQTLTPSAVPSERWGACMAFDRGRGRAVLHGGVDTGGPVGDVWEWDGARWTSQPSPLGPRFNAAMTYDSVRGRLQLFGGTSGTTFGAINELWERSDAGWTDRTPTSGGPPADSAPFAYDPGRQRSVALANGQTWEWDGGSWAQRAGASSTVANGAMVFDAQRGRLVMVGTAVGLSPALELWEFTGAAWSRAALDAGLAGRTEAPAVYDPVLGRTLLLGGATGLLVHDSVLAWDGARWEQLPERGPARYAHAAAYDPVHGETVLFGGRPDTASTLVSDTWLFGPEVPAQSATAFRFAFGAASAEAGLALREVHVQVEAGGDAALQGVAASGAALWLGDERQAFERQLSHDAGVASPAPLELRVTDPALLSRLLVSSRKDVWVAVTPAGVTAPQVAAAVQARAARLEVRYRRP